MRFGKYRWEKKNFEKISEDIGGVVRGCPIDYFTVPVTFKNEKGFVKLTGYEGSYSMNVSLEFRFVSLMLFYRRGLRSISCFSF